MSHLPLYKLPPCDPENLLSRESRQRIQAAYMAAERIKIQTLSRLQTRYRSEPSRGVGFSEYLSTGSAFIDLTESTMEAARTVLRAQAAEFQKLGLLTSPISRNYAMEHRGRG